MFVWVLLVWLVGAFGYWLFIAHDFMIVAFNWLVGCMFGILILAVLLLYY